MANIFDSLKEKLEIYRLEKRHMRRSKRTTFASNARYVDGEYVYTSSPLTLTSSDDSGSAWMEKRGPEVQIKRMLKRQSALF